jgi:integrase/recombinase XerD
MPRKGQRIKHRKPTAIKPGRPATVHVDPLAAHPLTRYMHAHFEWMLTHAYSADTVRARRIALRRFITWCAERHLDDPRVITKPMLERYQKSLFYYRKPDGQPLTLGSQHGCLAPLKTFFQWLARENHILYNPASELVLPKQPKRLPRTLLSVADIEAILREAEPVTAPGLRDRAMLELLYSTGLRRMEVPHLALYDVDLSRRLVFVREGKGRKDRVVPLGTGGGVGDEIPDRGTTRADGGRHRGAVYQRLRRADRAGVFGRQGEAVYGLRRHRQARCHAPV